MKYNRCRKAELVKFADDRGLIVSSKYTTGPFNRDYIAALKQADRNATFRFLDLPAELRNIVYEDLLTLRDSFSCFPQILLASKEVNKDATSILYGENYIDVKVYDDGIYVHGRRTGQYTPALLDRYRSIAERDFTTVVWPEFLRRALFLRVIVPDETKHYPTAVSSRGRDDSIGNIIYSLCRMLRQGNRLRAIHVVVQPIATSTPEALRAMLNPLGLLHNASTHITDHQNNSLANFHISPDVSRSAIVSAWSVSKLVYDCERARLQVQHAFRSRSASVSAPLSVNATYSAVRDMASTAMLQASSCDDDLPFWMHVVHTSIKRLRVTLEDLRSRRRCKTSRLAVARLSREVYTLLCLEIDLTTYFKDRLSSHQ